MQPRRLRKIIEQSARKRASWGFEPASLWPSLCPHCLWGNGAQTLSSGRVSETPLGAEPSLQARAKFLAGKTSRCWVDVTKTSVIHEGTRRPEMVRRSQELSLCLSSATTDSSERSFPGKGIWGRKTDNWCLKSISQEGWPWTHLSDQIPYGPSQGSLVSQGNGVQDGHLLRDGYTKFLGGA